MKEKLASPFAIGPVRVRNRVLLAPMSGVSDLPFRRLAWRYGAGLVVTEMVASRELCRDTAQSMLRMAGEGIRPHVVQLAGREPHWMAEAARIAVDHGADVVDINMGCPAKKVIGGYAGSALMRDPALALAIVEATVRAVSVPVTLKMRLGWDETSLNAAEIARAAEASGIAMLTVHGRTRCQFYEGRADWAAIGRVRDAVSAIPFVANGDVRTAAEAALILETTAADAVMVGRGSQGRPWFCGELAGAAAVPRSPKAIADLAEEHYAAMLVHYGEAIGIRHARKHLGWYLDRHAPSVAVSQRAEIMTGTAPERVIEGLKAAILSSGSRAAAPAKDAA
ncbi:MAG: tRNA dihydrouridine synthase DusB [Pararhizobium sp.]